MEIMVLRAQSMHASSLILNSAIVIGKATISWLGRKITLIAILGVSLFLARRLLKMNQEMRSRLQNCESSLSAQNILILDQKKKIQTLGDNLIEMDNTAKERELLLSQSMAEKSSQIAQAILKPIEEEMTLLQETLEEVQDKTLEEAQVISNDSFVKIDKKIKRFEKRLNDLQQRDIQKSAVLAAHSQKLITLRQHIEKSFLKARECYKKIGEIEDQLLDVALVPNIAKDNIETVKPEVENLTSPIKSNRKKGSKRRQEFVVDVQQAVLSPSKNKPLPVPLLEQEEGIED